MRTAVRNAFVVIGIASTAITLSISPGSAAVTTPVPTPAVAQIEPAAGELVGVGQPVTVTFTGPVADRDAAERAISITAISNTATNPVIGRFTWVDDHVVQWSADGYLPAHSQITALAGGFKTTFGTDAAVLGVADISDHTFTVSIDGQVVRTMPASMGKSKHPTPVGSFVALEKQSPVIMDSRTIGIPLSDPEGYKLTVYNAVRVTWGGVYVHAAPWSVASQGKENVSHGCINLSPDNAAWYYQNVGVGDPIIVNA